MSAVSFKCPNCGGDLRFDPASQKFKCEYCDSEFEEKDMEAVKPHIGEKSAFQSDETQEANREDTDWYLCPSCGAEIITDATTAATFCFYCHNPVILQGKLSGEYRPERIIPFTVAKKEAVDSFLRYMKKKKFVPKNFFCKEQIEKISGIYFPFWQYDCTIKGSWQGNAERVRISRTGNTEHTETWVYHLEREAQVRLDKLTKNALNKENRMLVEAVQPFDFGKGTEFKMEYLSGFQAEKRDIEKRDLQEELHKEAQEHAADLVKSKVQGYDTVTTLSKQFRVTEEHWQYLLVPAWVLTYRGNDQKTYFYAMNGQTGKISGELPVDKGRLLRLFLGIFAVAFLILLLGGYFLW